MAIPVKMPSPGKIFAIDNFGSNQEMAQFSNVEITTVIGTLPNVLYNGSSIMLNSSGVDLKLMCSGYKVPALDLNPKPVAVPAPATSQDGVDRDIFIAALVNMLGGAVTISDADLNQARRFELVALINKDPRYLILKTEPK